MQLSLFSISYAGLWGQAALELSQFLRRAAELGFSAVMLAGKRPHLSPLDATPELLARVEDALARTGLRCEVIAAYTDFAGGSAAEVPYVFERFWRADRVRSRAADRGGFGLGLAIGQWIAQAHGGALSVESRLGRGSTFTVHLPLPGTTGRHDDAVGGGAADRASTILTPD